MAQPHKLDAKTGRRLTRIVKRVPEAEGALEALTALFEDDYYVKQVGTLSEDDALVDFLVHANENRADPHPLFSTDYYLQVNPDVAEAGVNPLLHYCTSGHRENRSFHPLFDNNWYRRQFTVNPVPANSNLLLHYVSAEQKGSTTILFDPDWYSSQNSDLDSNLDPFDHYLRHGHKEDRSPHWAFDLAYFRSQIPTELHRQEPLAKYLELNGKADPHPLFSCRWYVSSYPDIEQAGVDPFVHYLRTGYREGRGFHPLFEVGRYRGGGESEIAQDECALRHYLENGWQEDRRPTLLFDAELYKELYADIVNAGVDPLVHYLQSGWQEGRRPHAGFDPAYYLKQEPTLTPGVDNPLLAFAMAKPEDRKKPIPWLDKGWYKKHNKGIDWSEKCVFRHYVEFGLGRDLTTSPALSKRYVYERCSNRSFIGEGFRRGYVAARLDEQDSILFITKDASSSDANRVLVNTLRALKQLGGITCHVVSNGPGPLVGTLERLANVYVMRHRNPQSKDIAPELKALMALWGRNPLACICMSTEVEHLRLAMRAHSRKSIAIAIDPPFDIPRHVLNSIATADAILTLSSQTRSQLLTLLAGEEANIEACALPASLAMDDAVDRSTLLTETIGCADSAQLVIGTGDLSLQRGPDLFALTAAEYFNRNPDSETVFVWIGDNSSMDDSKRLVDCTIDRERLDGRVVFSSNLDQLDSYLSAADIYLNTARSDTVGQDAIRAAHAGAQVVAFSGQGLNLEDLPENRAQFVRMGDVTGMATCIEHHLDSISSGGGHAPSPRSDTNRISLPSWIAENSGMDHNQFPPQKEATITKSPKIVVLTPDWSISGVNTFALHLIRQLHKRHRDVELLFTRGRFSEIGVGDELPDVPCKYLQPESRGPVHVWAELREYLRNIQPCVVIPNYDYWGSAVCPSLPRRTGVLGILHSDDPDHYEHYYRLGRYWDRIVGVSERIRKAATELNPSYGEKISTIHYGIPFTDRMPRRIRSGKNGPNRLKLVYTGRLVQKQKRILDFIPFCRALESSKIDFEIALVGDGSAEAELRSGLSDLIERGIVKMPGRVQPDDIHQYYLDADVFVLLSDFEGLPLSLLEAMECGAIPVVTEMDSGIPEVIKNRQNGYILPKQDFEAMAAVLRLLYEQPDRRLEMSNASRQSLISLGLTDTAMTDKYCTLIDEIATEITQHDYTRPAPITTAGRGPAIAPPPGLVQQKFLGQVPK